MSTSDPDRSQSSETLLRLVHAVADGESVDWGSASAAFPGHERTIRNLRGLEELRRAFSIPCDEDAGSGEAPAPSDTGIEIPKAWRHLQIVECIGGGAFADVFLARDPKLDRIVALKLLKPDRVASDSERFLREARLLAQVRNPNVVSVHGVDDHGGRPGMWMEHLRGKTLEARFEEQGRLSWREAAAVGIEICSALAAIHAKGLVHGDVKSANIVQDEGRHVLMDFGAAEVDVPTDLSESDTRGTPLVMAPEVFLGRTANSRTADIYSLGVMLYRLVSGSYPVDAQTRGELRERHLQRSSIPLQDRRADLPLPFVQVVERAIAFDPSSRFRTIAQMGKALMRTLDPAPAPVPAGVRRGTEWLVAHRKPLAAVTSVCLLGFVALKIVDPFPPLETHAALYRMVDGVATPLASGAAIGPGDALAMQFEASRDAYVYVFSEGERQPGKLYGLFPLSYGDLRNPLERGRKYLLPGLQDGQPIVWSPDETGGTERILVVASREPLPNVERWAADASSVTDEEEANGARVSKLTLRGIHPRPPSASKIDAIVRELGAPNKKVQWQVIAVESTGGKSPE